MKKSEFIKLALNDLGNTLFVNEEQVRTAVELFEKLGMGPVRMPKKIMRRDIEYMPYEDTEYVNKWSDE